MKALDLTARTVVVTGGASGIGAAVVHGLVELGARVMVLDRVASQEAGLSLICDVAEADSVATAFASIHRECEQIDGLVQCAGINRDAVLWKLSAEDWNAVLGVNLTGAFQVMKAAVPFMRGRGGAIVNVSSINGLRGKFGQANYAASKAGVIGLTKTAARELGRFGIRVNAVAPGLVRTPMTEDLPEDVVQAALQESALGRATQPEDVASTVIFLLSDHARQITGEVIKVDGGQYI